MKRGTDLDCVVIIGASSSIGGAITARFRKAARRVITTYTASVPTGQEEKLDAFHLDLQDDKSIKGLVKRISDVPCRLDAVVFLSAILPGKNLKGYDFASIDKVMSINFNGQAKLLQLMLPLLYERSSVLMLSSISAQRGSFDPIYAASKGAVLSLVKSLASQLPVGARINSVAPGLIEDSAMYDDMEPNRRQHHRTQIPSKELLNRDDLADVLFDLCQPHWRHLNGACIDLNGGQYVR